jgi:hypothetical protein
LRRVLAQELGEGNGLRSRECDLLGHGCPSTNCRDPRQFTRSRTSRNAREPRA